MNHRFPQPDEHGEIVSLPTVAVDLGFGAGKTCGLAWRTPGCEHRIQASYFDECAVRVAELVSDYPEAVLIIEAPLSGVFDSAGNPTGRVKFEKDHAGGRTVTRYWYVGAGGAIGLGAIFFFSRLSELLAGNSGTVHVVEGFISFKTQRLKDVEDALALLEGFCELDMDRSSDTEAGNYAAENAYTIMSKDSDFYQRSLLLEALPKVIWIR